VYDLGSVLKTLFCGHIKIGPKPIDKNYKNGNNDDQKPLLVSEQIFNFEWDKNIKI